MRKTYFSVSLSLCKLRRLSFKFNLSKRVNITLEKHLRDFDWSKTGGVMFLRFFRFMVNKDKTHEIGSNLTYFQIHLLASDPSRVSSAQPI